MESFKNNDEIKALYGDLASVKTLNDVINLSIAFDKPIKVRDMHYENPEKELLGDYSPDKEKKFGQYGGVATFYYNGIEYQIHVTDKVEEILISNGFVFDSSIASTLHNRFVPADYEEFWKHQAFEAECIWAKERLDNRESAIETAIANATCTPISDELILNRCFKVPKEGYEYIENNQRKIRKPVKDEMNESLTNRKITTLVGKMSKHVNGGGYSAQRTFVYLDGNTYVTESDEVISELQKHGFVESDDVQNLGLGWHEKIIDPYYANRYAKVVMSDEKYNSSKQEAKDQNERKIEFLEQKNQSLKSSYEQITAAIVSAYIKYYKESKNKGEEPMTPEVYVTDVLGLELSEEIVDEIKNHVNL